MKKLLTFLLLFLGFNSQAQFTTNGQYVYCNFADSFGNSNTISVTFAPISTPEVINTNGPLIYTASKTVVATNAYLSYTWLTPGLWNVTFGPRNEKVQITVGNTGTTNVLWGMITNVTITTNVPLLIVGPVGPQGPAGTPGIVPTNQVTNSFSGNWVVAFNSANIAITNLVVAGVPLNIDSSNNITFVATRTTIHNGSAPTTFTVPGSGTNWQNTNNFDIEVYISGHATVINYLQKNGGTIYQQNGTNEPSITFDLEPGETFKTVYTGSAPAGTYSAR